MHFISFGFNLLLFSIKEEHYEAMTFEVSLQPSEISLDVNMVLYMDSFLYIDYILVVLCGCLTLLL